MAVPEIEDVLTSPLRPWQLLLGYMSGGLLRAWLATLVLWLVSWPFAGGVDEPALVIAALLLTGFIFAVLGVITGMWSDTFDEHAFIANVLVTPLALVAGVFYSVERLGQPWRTLTRLDPIFYLVDAAPTATGVNETSTVAALAVAAGLAGALFVLIAALLERGWRLKA